MNIIRTSTFLVPLVLMFFQPLICSGQEESLGRSAGQSDTADTFESVELTYGMSRNLVIADLGSPEFESVIPSLQRARLIYSDDTVCVFDRDALVLVQPVLPPQMSGEGFAEVKGAQKVLQIDTRLLAAKPQLREPAVEQELVRNQKFFFAPGPLASMDNGIHFSPATGCLFGNACGAHCGGHGVACQNNACPVSASTDPVRRLMHRIKRDVFHVCP